MNHIAALAGAFGVRKNEKVCAFQYFQNFNFKKLEKPEPFVAAKHKPLTKPTNEIIAGSNAQ